MTVEELRVLTMAAQYRIASQRLQETREVLRQAGQAVDEANKAYWEAQNATNQAWQDLLQEVDGHNAGKGLR